MSSDKSVDQLLDEAQRALRKNDPTRALTLARRAASMAPMRQDIRQFMAILLEKTRFQDDPPARVTDEDEEAPAARPGFRSERPRHVPGVFASAEHTDSDEDDEPMPHSRGADEDDEDEPATGFLGGIKAGLNRLFATTPDDEDEERVEEPEEAPAPPPRARRATPPARVEPARVTERPRETERVRPAPPVLVRERHEESEPGEQEEATSPFIARLRRNAESSSLARRLSEIDEEEPAAATRVRRRRSSASVDADAPADPADEETPRPRRERARDVAEDAAAPRVQGPIERRLRNIAPRTAAWSVLLSGMVVFTLMASTVSYVQFFRAEDAPLPRRTAQAATTPDGLTAEDERKLVQANEFITGDKWDSAIELLNPLVKPDAPKPLLERASDLLALAHFRKGEALLRNTAGSQLAMPSEQQKLLDSVNNYRRAAELAPRKSLYQLHLGNALYYAGTLLSGDKATGHLEEALVAVKKAIDLDGKDPIAVETLAQIYERMEDKDQARAAWIRFREIAPTKDDARKASERLSQLSMADK